LNVKLGPFIAGVFGTVGFVLSIVSGVMSGNTVELILKRGVLCALGCYVVGYLAGIVAQQVAVEHARHVTEQVAAEDARQAAAEREKQAQLEAEAAAANARADEPVGAPAVPAAPAKG
jgi:hypothetical protein